jgi:hypothetical protein
MTGSYARLSSKSKEVRAIMSEDDDKRDDEITLWKVISSVGKAAGKTVQLIAEGTTSAAGAVNEGQKAVRNTMAVTEISTIFNTTDKTVTFHNRETARDSREILGQSSVSMRSENTSGAWVPWYDPPRFADFQRRHMAIEIDGVPVVYIWQKGDYVYWCNRLDSEGRPAKAYRMAGVSHVGGKRTLVVRNDPEVGYSVFLSKGFEGK